MSAPASALERRYYLAADKTSTYPLRFRLRKLGLRWEPETRQWYATSESARIAATQLLGITHAQPDAVEQPQPQPWQAPEQEQEQEQPPAVSSNDTAQQLATLVQRLAAGAMDENRVRALVAEGTAAAVAAVEEAREQLQEEITAQLASAGAARPVEIHVTDLPPVTFKAAHKLLPDVLARLSIMEDGRRVFRNVQLTGPAGSGKTMLAEQLAEALGLPFACESATPGMPESVLRGRSVPNLTTGETVYHPSMFVQLYDESGGVFLLDEGDNMDASTVLALNAPTANGHMTLLDGRRVQRHPDFIFVMACNTWGHGESREYVGRAQLDAAFLDRFTGAQFFMDYDADLERAVCPDTALLSKIHDMRSRMAGKVRRVLSTRAVRAAFALLRSGMSQSDALLAVTASWSASDRAVVGL